MNSIILKPGSPMPMKDRLEEAARLWMESGRDRQRLLTGTAFFLAQCWLNPSVFRRQQVDDYIAASKAALGGEAGWNAMLHEKAWCSHCSMSFHLENIGMCTECFEYLCGGCKEAHSKKCAGEVVG